MDNQIIQGNALNELAKLDSDSVDLICTDPPYGYNFMNKEWDKAVVSVSIWKECLRVLKAGAFAFIMSSPRQDVLSRMIVNLQDAGFRTDFSCLIWTFSSGFPKAANTTKMLEKRGIKKPELEGSYLGCQMKPAYENILVVQKCLSEKSFVDQALANGKGVTWLDDCRIPYQSESDFEYTKRFMTPKGNDGLLHYRQNNEKQGYDNLKKIPTAAPPPNQKGRFPANLLCSDDVLNDGSIHKGIGHFAKHKKTNKNMFTSYKERDQQEIIIKDFGSYSRYFSLDAWFNTTFPFIICPKPSRSEKNKGLENFTFESPVRFASTTKSGDMFPTKDVGSHVVKGNFHPTVKSIKLMSYLITLGSRENDLIIDPFCGSGTTLIAAELLHRKYIGIDINEEYCNISRARLKAYTTTGKLTDFL